MTLSYVGAAAASPQDLAYKGLVDLDLANNLTLAQVDAAINNAYSPYVLKSYVDQQDALNANKAFVDAGDAALAKLTQIDQPGGPPSLDVNGRVNPNRINVASTQRFPRGFWTPSAYQNAKTTLTAAEQQLFTVPVTDPGYAYRLMLFGEFDVDTFNLGYPPIINVRLDSVTGPIVATGVGSPSYYDCWSADEFDRSTSGNLGGSSFWNEIVVSGAGGNWSCNNGEALWNRSGSNINITVNQRVGADAITSGDYQRLSAQMLSVPDAGNDTYYAYNLLVGRISGDGKTWLAWAWSANNLALWSMTASATTPTVYNQINWPNGQAPSATDLIVGEFGSPTSGPNYYSVYRNNVLIIQIVDSGGTFSYGSTQRGWGFGGKAGQYTSFSVPYQQASPGTLYRVTVDDYFPASGGQNLFPMSTLALMPSRYGAQSVLTGAHTLYVTLANPKGSASQSAYKVEASAFRPNIAVSTVAA